MVPARIAQALSPWLFGIFIERWGAGSLWISAGLGLLAFLALLALPKPAEDAEPAHPGSVRTSASMNP